MSLYTWRADLQTRVTDVKYKTTIALRTGLGHSEKTDFITDMVAKGPYLQIRPGRLLNLEGDGGNMNRALYELPADLYVALNQSNTQTFENEENLLDDIRNAWDHLDNLTWDYPEIQEQFVRWRLVATIDPT